MNLWEYCYVVESYEPTNGGGLERELFIARPDRAEVTRELKPNQMLSVLGGEGWELVSVVGVQTQYSENSVEMAGVPHPSARQGSANVSSTVFYFKRSTQRP